MKCINWERKGKL